MADYGWRLVPQRRHPDKRLTWRGWVLMERTVDLHQQAVADDFAAAIALGTPDHQQTARDAAMRTLARELHPGFRVVSGAELDDPKWTHVATEIDGECVWVPLK
jgi:hypothetical protein